MLLKCISDNRSINYIFLDLLILLDELRDQG